MKKLLLVLFSVIISEIGFAQHTLVLYPVADCYVETYGGGVGKNSFLKFDITTIPNGVVLTNTKLRTFVSNILFGWDGDLRIIHYTNQTWNEGDSNQFIWQPIYFTDTIIQLFGFGTIPGWAETIDFNSFLDADYQASNSFFSILLKDVDDPTCCPNLSGKSINDNDSLMLGNIFNDNIVFRPREWVNSPPELVIDYGIPPTVLPVLPISPICENSSVSFSISVTGDAPFTYQWQLNGADIAGANTDIYSLASAQLADDGNYTCVVTNTYGSDISDTISLIVNPVPIISIVTTNLLCNGDASGAIDMTVANGTLPYNFAWSNGANTEDINGLFAGGYDPTVTDINNCTATTSITITEPAALSVTVSQTNVQIYGQCTGSATANGSGGITPYTYLWSNGYTNFNPSNLCAGTYCCTITDLNFCSITSCVTILQPNELIISTSQTNVTCNGSCDGTATITPSGGVAPYSYLWNPVGTNPSAMCAGTYGLTVTDSNGATATTSITITEPTLSVTVSQSNVICFGNCDGTVTLNVTGGTAPFTYMWSNGAIENPMTNLCAGIYCCTIVDANGCSVTSCVTITQPDELIVIATQTTSIICSGNCDGAVTIIATGGTPPYSYLWSTGGNGPTEPGLCVGNYNCIITDSNGCTAIITVIISEPSPITDTISSTNDNGGTGDGTATINVSGGTPLYTYQWDDLLLQTTPTATGLNAGLYHVTVTDANGCTIIDSVEVLITGIYSDIINNSFSLFPNPASTMITLNISTNKSEEITIIIYNNIGEIILRKDITLNSGDNSHTFDVKQFVPGIYFVKLQQYNNVSYIKFIKNSQ